MTAQHLTRIDPEANMRRYYRLSVQPGLFGDWSLVREWGRIGAQGQRMSEWYDDEAQAEEARDKLTRKKQRRGYQ